MKTSTRTQLSNVFWRKDAYFEDLFNDNYFEINDKSERTTDNEDSDGGD